MDKKIQSSRPPWRPAGGDLMHARLTAGLSRQAAADWLGVGLRHYRRLEAGTVAARPRHLERLRDAAGGLGALHPAWDGWRIDRDGRLCPPEPGAGYTPGDVRSLPYYLATVRAVQARDRQARARPTPGAPRAGVVRLSLKQSSR